MRNDCPFKDHLQGELSDLRHFCRKEPEKDMVVSTKPVNHPCQKGEQQSVSGFFGSTVGHFAAHVGLCDLVSVSTKFQAAEWNPAIEAPQFAGKHLRKFNSNSSCANLSNLNTCSPPTLDTK